MSPLVSVIIPTFKRSEMLPRAINSVLSQTYKNVQVVVVDDNNPNTDYRQLTENRMKLFANDNRVKYILHSKNSNGSVARNTGIKNADGEIVTFLDDDDVYRPDKIQKQVEFLLKNKRYRAVYCGWTREKEYIPSHQGNLSYDILSGDNIIYTNAIMMWKKDALSCGGWDETFLRHQEAAFLLRFFSKGGEIGVVSESLIDFDVSDRSNAPQNPDKNRDHVLHLLKNYIDTMECSENIEIKKKIVSHRYRGILLGYLKRRCFIGGLFFYFGALIKMPIRFNVDLIIYILKHV
ncbi:Glycosyltransferase involved in cell wall bisynthesis [Fibrobacter sp. UWB13]|nr:Glycosyltransferase involved in cell wall bisynthesis [Fibrobacter sp. UWB13]